MAFDFTVAPRDPNVLISINGVPAQEGKKVDAQRLSGDGMVTEADSAEIDAEAAIAQVLQAESSVKADAGRCREEAAEILARAEAAAQALAARTDARLVRLRERMRSRAAREVLALQSASGEVDPQDRNAAIENAAQRFADELLGVPR